MFRAALLGARLVPRTVSRFHSSKKPSMAAEAATPYIAAAFPLAIDLEAGKTYYWCTCGLSKNQPFCDGSHKGTTFSPLAFTADKSEKKYICQCKATKNAPFCDGSHKNEEFVKKYNAQLLKANTDLRTEVETLRAELAKLKGPKTDSV